MCIDDDSKEKDTCLLSPRSAWMNCNRPGSGNKPCNSSIAPILPRDKLSCASQDSGVMILETLTSESLEEELYIIHIGAPPTIKQ
jgi:hypothetical protein